MSRVFLEIGNIKIYWYSVLILIGLLIALYLIKKEAKKQKIKEEIIIDLVFYSLIIGIISARVYYVLFNLDYYLIYKSEIIKIYNGGLAIHGGIIGALIFIYFYTKKHKVNILKITDISVPGLMIAQSIGRWGNFFNQEAYGQITTKKNLENLNIPNFIIDKMYIKGEYRQPTFLYESLFLLIGFIIIIILRKKYKLNIGIITSLYLIYYGLLRIIIEYFRSDSLMILNIKVAQIVSIIFMIIGIIILLKRKKVKRNGK